MSGYFTSLAKLALGLGERIEPRLSGSYEEGRWDEAETEAATSASTNTAPQPSHAPPSPPLYETHLHLLGQTMRETRTDSVSDFRSTVQERTDATTIRESETSTVATERESREQTVETLRELVREAKSLHTERERLLETRSERIATLLAPPSESIFETERLVRETVARTERVSLVPVLNPPRAPSELPREPEITIHIGRIEVRADAPEPANNGEHKEKPKGVISLDDYLRERSREAKQ
ncbi:MAG TPA: hypothetical protein VGE01_04645 [Fimbriimonas sp.]